MSVPTIHGLGEPLRRIVALVPIADYALGGCPGVIKRMYDFILCVIRQQNLPWEGFLTSVFAHQEYCLTSDPVRVEVDVPGAAPL